MNTARGEAAKTLNPGPVDAFAGWHVSTGERTDAGAGQVDLTDPGKKAGSAQYRWAGKSISPCASTPKPRGNRRFPGPAVAATMSLPSVRVAEEAVSLMRASKTLGLEPGVGDADKQYWANSLTERLHDPAHNEGFTASTDYRFDRLGHQGGDQGALYIEGGTCCPATPSPLQNATKDLVGAVIDTATYRERIKGRTAFQLHQKEKPDAKGRVVLWCPAVGTSPTVTCPLRGIFKTRIKIAAFMNDKIKADAKKQTLGEPGVALVRRRDREWHNPHTGTYPPGVTPPGTATAPPVSDETGGPPRRT